MLAPQSYTNADLAFIAPRVLELTYTAHDLKPWATTARRSPSTPTAARSFAPSSMRTVRGSTVSRLRRIPHAAARAGRLGRPRTRSGGKGRPRTWLGERGRERRGPGRARLGAPPWARNRHGRERAAKALASVADQGTEVERMVRQRVGQDVFREALLDYWGGACAVTGLALPDVLRASHAKPWADCDTDEERLDVFNGFLLVAHLDALFDRGLITFDAGGAVVIAPYLAADHRALLHLGEALRLRWVAPEHLRFLQWHREHVFRG